MTKFTKIISSGSYLPKKILTNKELESRVDTSDEWITERTGIKERRVADDSETSVDLAYNAAIDAIKKSGINYGANLSNYTVWLLERSIKTLSVRVNTQNQNALDLANFLYASSLIKKVYYPGLENHFSHEIASKQMNGFGGMMSFEVIDKINPEDFVSDLKIISPTMSLAGVESSITSPSKTSHKKVDLQIRKKLGISDNLLRFSVGIEDIKDLMLDLDKSLKNNVR